MANSSKDLKVFKEILTRFVVDDDPLLSMMQWTMEQLMKIELQTVFLMLFNPQFNIFL